METRLISAGEVAARLGTSKGYAYRVIRRLNAELEERGILVVQGKVSADYFERRFFGNPAPTTAEKEAEDVG